MDLWLTPQGTARPDELLGVLGLQELVAAGAVLERARLELADETPTTPVGARSVSEGGLSLAHASGPVGVIPEHHGFGEEDPRRAAPPPEGPDETGPSPTN
jgi:hypothetical protein